MLRNVPFSVGFVTAYLFIFIGLLQFSANLAYGFLMFLLSPFVICWMVYAVLKHGKYDGPELGNNEFGYGDEMER